MKILRRIFLATLLFIPWTKAEVIGEYHHDQYQSYGFSDVKVLLGEMYFDNRATVQELLFKYLETPSLKVWSDGDSFLKILPHKYIYNNLDGTYSFHESFSVKTHLESTSSDGVRLGATGEINLSRIRKILHPAESFQQESLNLEPSIPSPDAYAEIEPWLEKTAAEAQNDPQIANSIFLDDITNRRFKEILSVLKLPSQVPFTADKVLNSSHVKTGDIYNYSGFGGIFAKFGKFFDYRDNGSWVGAFVQGNYTVGIYKKSPTKVQLKISLGTATGIEVAPIMLKLRKPILKGLAFGGGGSVKIRPIEIFGKYQDNNIWENAYELELGDPEVNRAFNAAIAGNLVPLHNLMDTNKYPHKMQQLYFMDSFQRQTYNRFKIDFAFVKLDSESEGLLEKIKVTTPQKNYFYINSLQVQNLENKVRFINLKKEKSYDSSIESVIATDSTYQSFTTAYSFLEFKYHHKNWSTSDKAHYTRSIEALIETDLPFDMRELSENQNLSIYFSQSIDTEAWQLIRSKSEQELWHYLGEKLISNPNAWDNADKRLQWRRSNEKTPFSLPYSNNKRVFGAYLYAMASNLVTLLSSDTSPYIFSKFLLKAKKKNAYNLLLPRLLKDLASPYKLSYEVQFVDEKQHYKAEYGKKVLNPYPFKKRPYIQAPSLSPEERFFHYANIEIKDINLFFNFNSSVPYYISNEQLHLSFFKFSSFLSLEKIDQHFTKNVTEVAVDPSQNIYNYQVHIPIWLFGDGTQYNLLDGKSYVVQAVKTDLQGTPQSEIASLKIKK